MSDTILVLNAGSSSIKFQLFEIGSEDRLERCLKGQIEGIGTRPHLIAVSGIKAAKAEETWTAADVPDVPAAIERLVLFLRQKVVEQLPVAVGHRVVHGGPHYAEPTVVDDAVLAELERFIPLAPLHQPNNLGPIRTIRTRQPNVLQVACFDTSFHRGHPDVADRYALPEQLYAEGVRRYGFHGLSYEFVASRLHDIAPDLARGRVVVAHLGSGASMCAIADGRSIESTMGFTALDGLPMGTRPGQLDPGIVLYLATEKGMSTKAIETFLYKECGLKGLSGISNDVRDLLASSDPRAASALDYFTYRVALYAGMLAAAMGGIDGFVFTGGIGENAPAVREAAANRMSWLGLELDREANAKGLDRISSPGSRCACLVVPTDEELMIARHTVAAVRRNAIEPAEEKRA
jgi:acetate kinase